jgi:hypothetical protein
MSNAALTDVGSPAAARPAPALNEDWLAVIIGLFIFVLGLAAVVHIDLIGWVVVSLRRAPRRSGYRSSGRSQFRLLPIPRQ